MYIQMGQELQMSSIMLIPNGIFFLPSTLGVCVCAWLVIVLCACVHAHIHFVCVPLTQVDLEQLSEPG